MEKLGTYVGFAIKSNHIIKGLDDLLKTKKRVGVVLVSNDLKSSSKEKLEKFTLARPLSVLSLEAGKMAELNLSGVKVFGITDPNLAQAIIKEYNKQN